MCDNQQQISENISNNNDSNFGLDLNECLALISNNQNLSHDFNFNQINNNNINIKESSNNFNNNSNIHLFSNNVINEKNNISNDFSPSDWEKIFNAEKTKVAQINTNSNDTNTHEFVDLENDFADLINVQSSLFRSGIDQLSLNEAPDKAAKCFYITISPRKYASLLPITRRQIFKPLSALFPIIVVSEQINQATKYRSHYHFKILIKSNESQPTEVILALMRILLRRLVGSDEQQFDIEDIINDNWPTIDEDKIPEIVIQSVQSMKDHLIKITALDFTPCYQGVLTTSFHSNWKTRDWAKRLYETGGAFSKTDPFVTSSHKAFSYYDDYFRAYCRERHVKHKLQRIECGSFGVAWKDECIAWWNDKVENPFYHKSPQLYLCGPPNSGKSTFIRQVILRGIPESDIFSPQQSPNSKSVSSFAWVGCDPDYHCVVLCEEFDMECYDRNLFKAITEGSSFNITKKHKNESHRLQLQMPMIFIAQYDLPKYYTTEKTGVPERLLRVVIPDKECMKYKVKKNLANTYDMHVAAQKTSTSNNNNRQQQKQQPLNVNVNTNIRNFRMFNQPSSSSSSSSLPSPITSSPMSSSPLASPLSQSTSSSTTTSLSESFLVEETDASLSSYSSCASRSELSNISQSSCSTSITSISSLPASETNFISKKLSKSLNINKSFSTSLSSLSSTLTLSPSMSSSSSSSIKEIKKENKISKKLNASSYTNNFISIQKNKKICLDYHQTNYDESHNPSKILNGFEVHNGDKEEQEMIDLTMEEETLIGDVDSHNETLTNTSIKCFQTTLPSKINSQTYDEIVTNIVLEEIISAIANVSVETDKIEETIIIN